MLDGQALTQVHPAKPQHLGAEYAAQFGDEEVAAAYQHRPPYPAETFAIVEPLLGPKPRCVLELGAGTGDFTIGLALCVNYLIAVEPSRPMLDRGRRRAGALGAHVEWHASPAETYGFDRRYSAVVAAEVSLLKSRPARLICILRTDPLSRRSWSDGSESFSGP
jgi:SAM-dependent methyltransferase